MYFSGLAKFVKESSCSSLLGISTGKETVKIEPISVSLSIEISPSKILMICWDSHSPRPVPPKFFQMLSFA